MNSFVIAAMIVGAAYGLASAFATFRAQMKDDTNVWFMTTCLGVIVFFLIVNNWE